MNTTATATTFQTALIAIAFAALASGMTVTAHAADSTGLLQETVKYGDLNVSIASGAAALYQRIRSAAERVCWPLDRADLASKGRFKACVTKATADAVNDVNQPALLAVYNAKNARTLPLIATAGESH